jgi:hypothetical protein
MNFTPHCERVGSSEVSTERLLVGDGLLRRNLMRWFLWHVYCGNRHQKQDDQNHRRNNKYPECKSKEVLAPIALSSGFPNPLFLFFCVHQYLATFVVNMFVLAGLADMAGQTITASSQYNSNPETGVGYTIT